MKRSLFVSRVVTSIIAFCCALLMVPLHGAEYYVDGNAGDDLNSGADDAPWRSITHAVNQASGSDVIHIHVATYQESISLAPLPKRGISLVGVAEGDQFPVIESAATGSDTLRLTNHTGRIEGLAITGAAEAIGINCTAVSGGTNSATIRGNRIYGNGVGVHVTTESGAESASPTIHGNQIYANTTRGIGNMMASSATISANRIYDNGSGIADNGGIGNSEESAALIINNLIYANRPSGVSVRDAAAPRIINNTLSGHREEGAAGAAVRVSQEQGIASLEVLNNILAFNDYGLLSEGGAAVTGNDFNLAWENASGDFFGFSAGVNAVLSDPLLVDVAANDYRPILGSPAIDSADPVAGVGSDLQGTTRPQGGAPDRGALEYFDGSVLTPPLLSLSVDGVTVSASWSASDFADGYTLYYAPPDLSVIGELDMGVERMISVELPLGAEYYVAVKAYNASTRSDYSNVERFVIEP